MPFSEAVAIAFSSLRANKLRSFLTVLGILIGVASVVTVVAIINGLDAYVATSVTALGTKSFTVQRIGITTNREQFLEMLKRKELLLDDVAWIRRVCDACSEVGAMVSTGRSARWGRVTHRDVQIMGITENYSRIGSVRDLLAGRHLVEDDVEGARPVAVIGADVMDGLFGLAEPLGKTITVDNHPLKVVGVATRKGSFFGQSQDSFLWIPITTYRKLYGYRSVNIQVEARTLALYETAQDQVRMALRVRRHVDYNESDDFSIETGESIMNIWQSFTAGISVVIVVVTGISLLVGGIVVMNIMLVSVAERVQEIGVRKALGARRRDILRQFLVESVMLALFGGLLGVAAAALASWSIAAMLSSMMSSAFSVPIQPWAVTLALAVSSTVGLVAGIYPAGRAARLDPVIALRSE